MTKHHNHGGGDEVWRFNFCTAGRGPGSASANGPEYPPALTGFAGGAYEDHAGQAWHFRRDPHEIEGAWSKTDRSYFYVGEDVGRYRTERAFLEAYRDDRLRRVLAEAVPGVGGLRLEPEW